MLICPAIGDTDPIRYHHPTPDGQFSGNIFDEAMRPPKARTSAKPSGATLRCAPPALALRRHNLEGGQLFDADPGQQFGAV
jgi:hypothetical protein